MVDGPDRQVGRDSALQRRRRLRRQRMKRSICSFQGIQSSPRVTNVLEIWASNLEFGRMV